MYNILILVLNMDKNVDRWKRLEPYLIKITQIYGIKYIRIPAIDGNTMDNNEEVRNIIKIRPNLLNTEFKCIESKEKWLYDGSISKSFPCLHKKGHFGTKGLTLSNIKAFSTIKNIYPNYKWYLILEDDVYIHRGIIRIITKYLHIFNKYDVIVLDIRSKGGASAIMYSNNIIDPLLEHMHPLSDFSIINEGKYKMGTNLWDWKLWSFLDNYHIKYKLYPLCRSGKFKSTIS